MTPGQRPGPQAHRQGARANQRAPIGARRCGALTSALPCHAFKPVTRKPHHRAGPSAPRTAVPAKDNVTDSPGRVARPRGGCHASGDCPGHRRGTDQGIPGRCGCGGRHPPAAAPAACPAHVAVDGYLADRAWPGPAASAPAAARSTGGLRPPRRTLHARRICEPPLSGHRYDARSAAAARPATTPARISRRPGGNGSPAPSGRGGPPSRLRPPAPGRAATA